MKKVLSLLVAFVFLQVQSWALSGGPQYGGTAGLIGTYAGTFTGVKSTVPVPGSTAIVGSNSLGVFVIAVPETDLAQGTIALFFEGIFYQGGVVGAADPSKSTLNLVAQMIHVSTFNRVSGFFFDVTTIDYDSRCDGTLTIKVGKGNSGLKGTGTFTVSNLVRAPVTTTTTTGVPPVTTTTTTIVNTFPPAGTLGFQVNGYKQSEKVVIPKLDLAAVLSGNSGGNGGGGGVILF